jgi:hypothetical protein
LEAGPLSQWLFSALADAELPVVCVETRHMQRRAKEVDCTGLGWKSEHLVQMPWQIRK